MALIICKHCGRKVSDTVSDCIHCGNSLQTEELVENSAPIVEDKFIEPEKKSFNALNSDTRYALEQEFLTVDKKALKIKRTEAEFKKFSSLCSTMIFLGLALILISRFVAQRIFKGEIYDEKMLLVGACLIIFGLIGGGIVCGIINIVLKIIYKRSAKRCIYLKRFQIWLYETKDLRYEPIFINKREEAIFKKLDL